MTYYTYKVVFNDGTVRQIAKSKRQYTHAWKYGDQTGFSSSKHGAIKNGVLEVNRYLEDDKKISAMDLEIRIVSVKEIS